MATVKQVRTPSKPQFDPGKNYRWDPTDIFELTGQKFASLYHCLQQEMSNVGGAPLHLKVEAYNVIMEIFKQGVEQGVITESELNAEVKGQIKELDDKVGKIFNSDKTPSNGNNY
jgi:hypothetical protein